jgi:hypothetical protein
MNRLQPYYDKLARTYSLNWAIALSLVAACYGFLGLLQSLRYFENHQSFWLIFGPFNFFLGSMGVFQGVNVIHAVVRRLIAESRP